MQSSVPLEAGSTGADHDGARVTTRGAIAFFAGVLTLLCVNALYGQYDDEWDNILGGLRVSEGAALYREYFSHHFPLPYLVAASIQLLLPRDFVLFRLVWAGCLAVIFGALLLRSSRLGNGRVATLAIVTLIAFSPVAWLHLLHADNLVALSVLVVLLYVWSAHRASLSQLDYMVIGMLPAIIIMSSVGYVLLAIVIAGVGISLALTRDRTQLGISLASMTAGMLMVFLPLIGYLIFHDALGDWYDQAIVFNQQYYFRFIGNKPPDPLQALLAVAMGVPASAVRTFALLSPSAPWWVWLYASMFALVGAFCFLYRFRLGAVVATFAIGYFALSRFNPVFDVANNRNVPFYPVACFALWGVIDAILPRLSAFLARRRQLTIFLIFVATWGWVGRPLCGEQRINNHDAVAEFFNNRLSPDDRYWIGPFRFRSQYFVTMGAPASRYAFFLPWHAASDELTNSLLRDIARHRPRYIAFDKELRVWRYNVKDYAAPLYDYIVKHYREVEGSSDSESLPVWRRRRTPLGD